MTWPPPDIHDWMPYPLRFADLGSGVAASDVRQARRHVLRGDREFVYDPTQESWVL